MPSGTFKKLRKDYHISFWSMLMMLMLGQSKNIEALVETSREVGLDVNTEKIK
jgi:hypothetical protein